MIKLVLTLAGIERFDHGVTLRVRHISGDLPAQRAVTEGLQPCFKRIKHLRLAQTGELLAEALQVTKGVVINDADEAIQL